MSDRRCDCLAGDPCEHPEPTAAEVEEIRNWVRANREPVTADVQRELARRRIWQALEWVGVLDGSNDPGRDEAYLNAEIDSTLTALIADAEKRAAAKALMRAAIDRLTPGTLAARASAFDAAAAAEVASLDPSGAAEGGRTVSARRRCPPGCPCLCHDTGGVGHGSGPCPTKLGQPVPDDWKPA